MTAFSRIVAIIPARGGSKGLPGKNIRALAGKPLIAHSIEHARSTARISRTIVSTDDDAIADVAVRFGAEVARRPAEISGDTASSESALLHVVDWLRDRERFEPDLIVFLQATSPLRARADIANAIATLERESADSLFSACEMHGFVWRLAKEPASITYDFRHRPRRQDGPVHVVENGSIYVFKPWVLRDEGNRLGGRIAVYEMPPRSLVQIDTPADFDVLEALMARSIDEITGSAFAGVRLLVLDFDGVMTDNRVLVFDDGHEAVMCHRGDGWGIGQLRSAGLEVLVLSTEANPVVEARCRKLQIPFVQNCSHKLARLQQLAAERSLASHEIAYVGNDVNDLSCLQWVGVPIAVADAEPEVKTAARFVTTRNGGFGAVREIADAWLRAHEQVKSGVES